MKFQVLTRIWWRSIDTVILVIGMRCNDGQLSSDIPIWLDRSTATPL